MKSAPFINSKFTDVNRKLFKGLEKFSTIVESPSTSLPSCCS